MDIEDFFRFIGRGLLLIPSLFMLFFGISVWLRLAWVFKMPDKTIIFLAVAIIISLVAGLVLSAVFQDPGQENSGLEVAALVALIVAIVVLLPHIF